MNTVEKIARIKRVRKLAAEGWTQSEITFELKLTVSGTAGFLQRNGIRLTPKKGGRTAHGAGRRPRMSRSKTVAQVASNKPKIAMSLATHVVVEKMRQVPTSMPPCLWHGCKRHTMTLGKPYCAAHHKQGGGLFCS